MDTPSLTGMGRLLAVDRTVNPDLERKVESFAQRGQPQPKLERLCGGGRRAMRRRGGSGRKRLGAEAPCARAAGKRHSTRVRTPPGGGADLLVF